MTHQRRATGKARKTVTFKENKKVTMKKDNFLSKPKNKQQLIDMLSWFLQENNYPTYAENDANVLIVKTAIESDRERNTVFVGDDTNSLVLLCFYTIVSTLISSRTKGKLQKMSLGHESKRTIR